MRNVASLFSSAWYTSAGCHIKYRVYKDCLHSLNHVALPLRRAIVMSIGMLRTTTFCRSKIHMLDERRLNRSTKARVARKSSAEFHDILTSHLFASFARARGSLAREINVIHNTMNQTMNTLTSSIFTHFTSSQKFAEGTICNHSSARDLTFFFRGAVRRRG